MGQARKSLKLMIADALLTHADHVAVRMPEPVSYSELRNDVQRRVDQLIASGATHSDLIAIHYPRSYDSVVCLLAVVTFGATVLVIDPEWPDLRKRQVISAARPSVVLAASGDPLITRTWMAGLDDHARFDPLGRAAAEDDYCACLHFTSGSTGAPKGVLGSANGWALMLDWMLRRHPLGPGRTVLHKTALGFVDALVEVLWCILGGATLSILPSAVERTRGTLWDQIAACGATDVLITPTMLAAVLEASPADANLRTTSLRRIISSGEPLSVSLAHSTIETLGVELHNQWGMTETSAMTSWCEATSRDSDQEYVDIGIAIEGSDILVLTADMQPSPVGVEGDIWAAGAGLALGYLDNPEQTAAAYRRHPDGRWLYRTGDRGKFDGSKFHVTGRSDLQVKIRGVRVDLQAVESVLASIDGVDGSICVKTEAGDLAAVVVTTVPDEVLRQKLSERLPTAFIPSRFQVVNTLPRTVNGKLDRAAASRSFPTLAFARLDSPGRGHAVERVCEIWREVLGLPSIDLDADFFSVGGHSLSAMRIVGRLAREFDTSISVGEFLEWRTIRRVAAGLGESPKLSMPAGEDGRNSRHAQDLSHNEMRQWFLHQVSASSRLGSPLLLETRMPLVKDAVSAAVRQLLERHGSLRAIYTIADGQVRRKLRPVPQNLGDVLQFHRLSAASLSGRKQEEERLLSELASQPFDIDHDLPVRMHVLEHGPAEWKIAFLIHTVATDGWSNNIVARDFGHAYARLMRDEGDSATDVPQYDRYVSWQRAALGAPALGEHRRQIADEFRQQTWAANPLPSAGNASACQRPILRMPFLLRADLQTYCRGHHVTPYAALLGVLSVLIFHWCRRHWHTVTTPFSNRVVPEFEEIVGCLVNPVVLRVAMTADQSFDDLAATISHTAGRLLDRQILPYDEVVEIFRSSGGEGALSNLVFVLQDETSQDLGETGFRKLPADAMHVVDGTLTQASEAAEFPLHIEAVDFGSRLDFVYKFDSHSYDEAFIRTLHFAVEGIAAECLARGTTTISSMSSIVQPLLSASMPSQPTEVPRLQVEPVQ